jgi:hypothetical protein
MAFNKRLNIDLGDAGAPLGKLGYSFNNWMHSNAEQR